MKNEIETFNMQIWSVGVSNRVAYSHRKNGACSMWSTEAMTSQKLFLVFSVLDTMYRWSMMKNIHSPNLVGIG